MAPIENVLSWLPPYERNVGYIWPSGAKFNIDLILNCYTTTPNGISPIGAKTLKKRCQWYYVMVKFYNLTFYIRKLVAGFFIDSVRRTRVA